MNGRRPASDDPAERAACISSSPDRAPFRTHGGVVSRQANLAVDYLDALGPATVAALHPTSWPRVVIIDSRSLFTRGDRAVRGGDTDGVPDKAWVGEFKVGTVRVALDGIARRPAPCVMRVAGGKDARVVARLRRGALGCPRGRRGPRCTDGPRLALARPPGQGRAHPIHRSTPGAGLPLRLAPASRRTHRGRIQGLAGRSGLVRSA